mmetsp:Transcript_39986/g.93864  ORF Transcript_39986/g.93864 Transcript_39986/m.93864 type:complete len:205 (-) Transcript_39986:102-716(-)
MNETAFRRISGISAKEKPPIPTSPRINAEKSGLGLNNSHAVQKRIQKDSCAFNPKDHHSHRPIKIVRWLQRPRGPITVPASIISVDSNSSKHKKKKSKIMLPREMLKEIDEDSVLRCLDEINVVGENSVTLDFPVEIEIFEKKAAQTRDDIGSSFSSISVMTQSHFHSNDSLDSFPTFKAVEESLGSISSTSGVSYAACRDMKI